MNLIFGVVLLSMGAIFIVWGDKVLARDTPLLRSISWTRGRERLMRWLVGIALIVCGVLTLNAR